VRIVGLFGVTLAAGAGLFGAALTFAPSAEAAPLMMGGPTCTEQMAGPVAAAAPVPMALPGPLPGAGGAPVLPAAPAVPAAPVVPAAAPAAAAAPVPAGAPLLTMAGTGKGVPTDPGPALTAFPVIRPGPPPPPDPLPPAPVTDATLTAALTPAPSCCR
jgi:hypothetical protein